MDENKPRGKLLLLSAALTAWPLVVPVIGLLFEATGMFPQTAAQPPAAFVLFLVILCLTPLEVLALLAFYLGYLFTRPHMPMDRKLVWAMTLVIGHVFVMPFFWYLVIWRARYPAPMQPASRFSLIVFSPLLVALLLPLAYLLPMTLLDAAALIPGSEPVEASQTALQWAWVVGPLLAVAVIFVSGKLCYTWFTRKGSRRAAWIFLWGFFSLMSFVTIWYAIMVLRSLLPSDAPPNTPRDLTRIAVILALILQPGVAGWLFVVSRLLRNSGLANLSKLE